MNQIEAKKQRIEYFSHILGLISLMVLGKLIGNNGLTYMALIIECVSLFVVLINGSGADMIGKLIRTRRKKNQYREAALLHKTYVWVQCIMALSDGCDEGINTCYRTSCVTVSDAGVFSGNGSESSNSCMRCFPSVVVLVILPFVGSEIDCLWRKSCRIAE